MNPELVKKILQYAPEPPAKVWEGISKMLDENLPGDLADKLQQFQAAPPEGTWNKIEEKLGFVNQAPVRKVKFFTFARIASAAAVILIATASIIYWNRGELPETITVNNAGNLSTENKPENSQSSPSDQPGNVEPENKEGDLVAVNPPVIREEKHIAIHRPRPAKQSHVHFAATTTEVHSFIPNQAEEKAIAVSSYPIDKYMVYSDDNGNAMRLSKKLFDLISCVKEEVVCAEHVQQMQYKVANYITTNDFYGLMEMLRNMKENK